MKWNALYGRAFPSVRFQLTAVLRNNQTLTTGRCVDKTGAVRWCHDEDTCGEGIGILVAESDKPTEARYRLKNPDEVQHFLDALVERLEAGIE